jgi:hypothetical protein
MKTKRLLFFFSAVFAIVLMLVSVNSVGLCGDNDPFSISSGKVFKITTPARSIYVEIQPVTQCPVPPDLTEEGGFRREELNGKISKAEHKIVYLPCGHAVVDITKNTTYYCTPYYCYPI